MTNHLPSRSAADVELPRVLRLLSSARLALGNEKATQDSIERVLSAASIEHEREVRLSASDVIDFMVGTIGIEVKIKGTPKDIYRQILRYAEHERIGTIVLATNKAMNLPALVLGKPTAVVSLGMGWL